MKIFGIAGWSGSGKTTLLEKLIPRLIARGLKVSVIKHAHHGFDIDKPGKDSWRHREAGAGEVMLASGSRWALMHECRNEPEPVLADLVARLAPCDLVLVEGFKQEPVPKLEVHRPANGKPPLFAERDDIVAVACDEPIAAPIPVLPLNDIDAVADFVIRHCNLQVTPC
ncbi:MAG: molybdopterin-guanine dinucleotide biosynthesis protein B [Azonexaceae bacterium]|nr:molybdopterin-guanine dinucleotide biosynthesis protein B [Azonexaceae bacterium]